MYVKLVFHSKERTYIEVDNKVLKIIFGHERQKVRAGRRKSHN
jgi:hypothetical protein